MGDREKSLKFLKKAYALGARSWFTYHGIADDYIELGQYDKAEGMLREFLRVNPGNKEALDMLNSISSEAEKG